MGVSTQTSVLTQWEATTAPAQQDSLYPKTREHVKVELIIHIIPSY